jgi:hypothetical protein
MQPTPYEQDYALHGQVLSLTERMRGIMNTKRSYEQLCAMIFHFIGVCAHFKRQVALGKALERTSIRCNRVRDKLPSSQ